jgi:type VI secretion system protein ImpJ
MFLRPHHLQQHELSIQGRIDYHLRSIDPFHWGVKLLQVNEEALSARKIEILRLEAVLPGGAIVRLPEDAHLEQPREFAAGRPFVDVYLGLRRLNPARANSARPELEAKDARYRIRVDQVPDLERGGFEVPVQVLIPNLRLFVSGEEQDLEAHDSLRLFRIEATGDLKQPYAICPTQAPPLLAVQAFAPLDELVRGMVAQIAARFAVVASRTEAIAIGELPRMWMRYTLARMTPVLRQLLATGETHPFALYNALLETAGGLSAFRHRECPRFPDYRHEDPYACFAALLREIDSLLEEVSDAFVERRLAHDAAARAYVTRDLSMELLNPQNGFTLAVKASLDSKELVKLVQTEGKASSARNASQLADHFLPGLSLEPLHAEPTTISGPPGAVYFKVEPHGDRWAKVCSELTFALSLERLRSADVRLYIVSRKT